MSTEIQKFDAEQAMKNVRDRIKDSFVSLIPDEQWNEMVKKEVDSYFKPTEEGYGNRGYSSSFTKDVHALLTQEVKTRVANYLSEHGDGVWGNNGLPIVNEKIQQLIVDNSGAFLTNLIGGFIQQAFSNAGYQLRS